MESIWPSKHKVFSIFPFADRMLLVPEVGADAMDELG